MNQPYLLLFQSYEERKGITLRQAEQHAGRTLLNQGFQEFFQTDISKLPISLGAHGKPYFKEYPDYYFNISHSHGLAAAVFSWSPVGLDLQIQNQAHEKIWHKVCTPKELDFLKQSSDKILSFARIWTSKESYLKYTGEGLSVPLYSLKIPDHVTQMTLVMQSGYCLTITYET